MMTRDMANKIITAIILATKEADCLGSPLGILYAGIITSYPDTNLDDFTFIIGLGRKGGVIEDASKDCIRLTEKGKAVAVKIEEHYAAAAAGR